MANITTMLLALALTTTVTALPPPRAVRLLPEEARSTGRLAQAEAPAPTVVELQQQIDGLNARIRALRTDWPVGSLIAAYFGFSMTALVLPGLVLVGVAGLLGDAGVVLVIGAALLVLGAVGLALGIAAVVVGAGAAAEARDTRQQLIEQRDELKRQLELLQRPQSVQRPWAPQSLLTVAVF